jgi:O-antigen ligase
VSSAQTQAARALSAIIFYGLIGLVFLTPAPYGTVEPWSQAAFACAVFALGFLWCIHALLSGSSLTFDPRLFLPLIAFVVFAILQSLSWSQSTVAGVKVANALSADPFESRIFALRLGALVLAAMMAAHFTNTATRLRTLTNALILVALLSAVFGIVRLTMQHKEGFVLQSLHWGGGFAQFINKNHFAFLIEPAIGLLIAMILLRQNAGHRKLIYLSGLILLWAALVMSRSRGGLLAASVQMIAAALYFIYTRGRSRQAKRPRTRSIGIAAITIIVIIVVVGGTTIWLGGDQLSTGVDTATSEMTSTRDENHEGARRRDIWRATLLMARAHPIAGSGLGGYWAEIPGYHDASGVLTPQQGHNDYLELLASGGLIGVGLFVWFLVAFVQRSRKALANFTGIQRAFAVGAIIGVVGVGVHSLVDFGLHMTGNALVFVMLFALLSADKIDQRPATQAHRSPAFN